MEFFTVNEFAEKLKLNPQTIRRGIRQGKFYAVRVGIGAKSHYRIPKTELERLEIASRYKESK